MFEIFAGWMRVPDAWIEDNLEFTVNRRRSVAMHVLSDCVHVVLFSCCSSFMHLQRWWLYLQNYVI